MPFELPEFKRCCFFLPLRGGLIVWGYIRLVLDVLATVFFGFASLFMLIFSRSQLTMVSVVVIISLLLFDIGFTILLIIAGHMKSAKLMHISFIYSVVWLFLIHAVGMCVTVGCFLYMYDVWTSGNYGQVISTLLTSAAFLFSITFVNVYIIMLIHSEAKKLRKQSLEMQFVNSAAEGKAACVRAGIDHV